MNCRPREIDVAYGLVYLFEGVTEAQYWAVNEKLGIARDGSGDWPAGLVSHGGGPTADGGWLVTEIWTSKAGQEKFMAERLGAAIAAVGVPAPSQLIESELVNHLLP
jgi:hypothetical protein